MPYIGNTIRAADDYRLIDDISSGFNGSETSFALQVAGSAPVPFPKSPQQVLISVNGVIQEPDPTGSSGFNLVGTNIVFSSAPTNGHAFFGIIYATADYLNAGGNFPAGSLGAPSITFIGDENTGLFRKSGGSVGFVSDATEIANFDSNGITISSGNIIIPDSIIHNGDTNTKIRFPAADTVTIETGGTQRLFLGNADTVFNETGADVNLRIESDGNANCFTLDAGKSGIGINQEPATGYGLDILGNSGYDDVIRITGVGTNIGPRFNLTPTGTGVGRINATANSLQLQTGGTTAITIDTSQKVGIGTTSPERQLHVLNSSGDALVRITSADGNAAYLELGDASDRDAGKIVYDNGDNLTFSTANSGSTTEKLRIQGNGNVGIGTTSPGHLLEIKSSAQNANDVLTQIESVAVSSGESKTSLELHKGTGYGAQLSGYISQGVGSGFILSTLNGGTATERMRIDSSGNVSIGNSSPESDATHHILTLAGKSSNGAGGISFVDTSSNVDAFIFADTGSLFLNADYDNATADSSIRFRVDGSSEKMRIDSSGNVGLGVTSVSNARFRIKGANNDTTAFNDGVYVESNNGSVFKKYSWMGIETQGGMHFSEITGGVGETMRISTDGNVGIGVSTMDARLHVVNAANQLNMVIATSNTFTGNASLVSFRSVSSEGGFIALTNNGTTTAFGTSSDYRLKENATTISDGITRLKTLKPYRFNFKAAPDTTVDGFFAHEVTAVPEAVIGEKDGEQMQGLDYAKLTPLLTAALQEAITKIETLETKVAALEAA